MNAMPPSDAPLPPHTRRFVHDLRNCLASVRAGANVLRRSGHRPEIVEQVVAGLHEQVQEMLALVDKFVGRVVATEETPHAGDPVATNSFPTSLRILVADDNADAANTLATYLRLSGHQPVVALDGAEVLRLAAENPPDVILLDLGMPTVSGYDVARAIRTEVWGSAVRLIAVSGWLSAEDIDQASDAGFDAHMSKPIDMDALPRMLYPAH